MGAGGQGGGGGGQGGGGDQLLRTPEQTPGFRQSISGQQQGAKGGGAGQQGSQSLQLRSPTIGFPGGGGVGNQAVDPLQGFSNRVESPLEQQARGVTTGLGNLQGTEQVGLGLAGGLGNLRGSELNALGTAGQLSSGGLNQPEQAALQGINFFAGGPLGQSPATQAALASIRPQVQNQLALAGLGNSAEVGSALASASGPILAQEIASRQGAIGQLTGLGETVRGSQQFGAGLQSQIAQAQRQGNTQAAQLFQQAGAAQRAGRIQEANQLNQQAQTLSQRESRLIGELQQSEEAQRQVQAQQFEANFQDFLRRQGLAQNLTTGLLGGLPNILGSRTVSESGGGGK